MLPNYKYLKINVRSRFQIALTCKSFLMRMPFFVLVVAYLSLTACGLFNNNEIETFKVTPISAVEVALEISADSGDKISIERDGNEIFSFRMSRKDTVVYDSGLTPNTSYIWKAINKSSRRDKNKERQATTLTTTSSDFTWQTFSFGEHSSSTLYGVSIIDENNIWAVGEIFMNDSTGQTDDQIYNAAHWDGNEWTLKRVVVNFRGNNITPPLEGVHAFSDNNIWLAGSLPIYGDGETWELFDVRTTVDESLSLWEVWGSNSTQVYSAGKSGSLAYYDGQDWQKIETGTELDIEDIHGNEEQGVVAIASKQFVTSEKKIIQINENQTVKELSVEGIPFSIQGIWFDEIGVPYVVGSGIYRKTGFESPEHWTPIHNGITEYYLRAIDANGLNDIVISGDFGELLHFNGATWTSFQSEFFGNPLFDVDIKEDVIAAVGLSGRQAFITIGKRE